MNMPSTPGYGDAPLGVECALPDEAPRLARPGEVPAGLWRRMIYRIKYGIKITPAGRPYRSV
jgi:hypothetical protein